MLSTRKIRRKIMAHPEFQKIKKNLEEHPEQIPEFEDRVEKEFGVRLDWTQILKNSN